MYAVTMRMAGVKARYGMVRLSGLMHTARWYINLLSSSSSEDDSVAVANTWGCLTVDMDCQCPDSTTQLTLNTCRCAEASADHWAVCIPEAEPTHMCILLA